MCIQYDAIHVKIKTTGNYKSLTDNSKKYEDMHRHDKHHIQENYKAIVTKTVLTYR